MGLGWFRRDFSERLSTYTMDTAQQSLTTLVEKTRERVAAQKELLSPEDLASRVQALVAEELADNTTREIVDRAGNAIFTHPFYASISRPGVVSIAEIVRGETAAATEASPFPFLDPAIACAAAGVGALSYVVEPSVFGGSEEEFLEIADTVGAPILHKDIILDPYQVDLAFAQGAQAVTLVARILSGEELKKLSERAHERGMDVVVAVQSEEDLARALEAEAFIISINDVLLCETPLSFDEVAALCGAIPEERLVLVGGIRSMDEVAPLVELNVKGVFLGDMLVRADDCRSVVRAFDKVVDEALIALMPTSGSAGPGAGMPEPGMPGPVEQPGDMFGPDGAPWSDSMFAPEGMPGPGNISENSK